jgi:hypothetical protein
VPICEAAGQPAAVVRSDCANCASVHASRPAPSDGFTVMPSGSTVVDCRTSAWRRGTSLLGRVSVTPTCAGTSVCVVERSSAMPASNGSVPQAVGV